jgi:hypothetical protein
MKLAARQPGQLPRQEVKVERGFTCLPAGCQPEAWGRFYTGWPPAAACPGSLERASASTWAATAICRMSDVTSATQESCLHWRAIHGSETQER